jgi:hypothetical protein
MNQKLGIKNDDANTSECMGIGNTSLISRQFIANTTTLFRETFRLVPKK